MAAFELHAGKHRHIPKGPDTKRAHLLLDNLVHPRAHPVKNHPRNAAVRPVPDKTLHQRQHGLSQPPRIHHQHRRGQQRPGQLKGRAPVRAKPRAVIVAHHALNERKITRLPRKAFPEKHPGRLFAGKIAVQVFCGCPDHPRMKHGIDIIRPALKRKGPESTFRERRQKPHREHRFPAAAAGRPQQKPRHHDFFFHFRSLPPHIPVPRSADVPGMRQPGLPCQSIPLPLTHPSGLFPAELLPRLR